VPQPRGPRHAPRRHPHPKAEATGALLTHPWLRCAQEPLRMRRPPCSGDGGELPCPCCSPCVPRQSRHRRGHDQVGAPGIGVCPRAAAHARARPWAGLSRGPARASRWHRHERCAVLRARVAQVTTTLARGNVGDGPVAPRRLANPAAGCCSGPRGRAGQVHQPHVLDGDQAVARGEVARGCAPFAFGPRELTRRATAAMVRRGRLAQRGRWCFLASVSLRAV